MQTGSGISVRDAWYDRGFAADIKTFRASQSTVHAATERTTYTVPAGKKAFVVVNLNMAGSTNATGNSPNMILVYVKPSGGAKTQVGGFDIGAQIVNTGQTRLGQSFEVLLDAGDIISTETTVTSATGSFGINISTYAQEFTQ